MGPIPTRFAFALPGWLAELAAGEAVVLGTRAARMRFVIELARQNVRERSGGPFGAAVFDAAGRLLAPGVNLVASRNCSILHAEMVAIALAQRRLGAHELSGGGQRDCELVASAEPCAMCFGAVPWSGVTRLVCGARDEDVRRIGFDEGAKLPDWQDALKARGVRVWQDVLRREAVAVLALYAASGGPVYNGGGPGARQR